jgi:hypothetical protein
MMKSGFGAKTLGRSIAPEVAEAAAIIPIKNAHTGTGLFQFTGRRTYSMMDAFFHNTLPNDQKSKRFIGRGWGLARTCGKLT